MTNSTFWGALMIASVLAGCMGEVSSPTNGAMTIDRRASGESHAALVGEDPCDLTGLYVCTAEYEDAMYECGYDGCIEMGADPITAQECGDSYRRSAENDCGYVADERYLWCTGAVDPSTISACWQPGGACCCDEFPETCGDDDVSDGPTTSGGGGGDYDQQPDAPPSCTWCSCIGDYTEWSGEVCGSDTTELVQDCWNSCW